MFNRLAFKIAVVLSTTNFLRILIKTTTTTTVKKLEIDSISLKINEPVCDLLECACLT